MCEMTGKADAGDRSELWRTKRVIFATPQCVEHDIKRGTLALVLSVNSGCVLVVSYFRNRMGQARAPRTRLSVWWLTRRIALSVTTVLCRGSRDRRSQPALLALTATPGGSLTVVLLR